MVKLMDYSVSLVTSGNLSILSRLERLLDTLGGLQLVFLIICRLLRTEVEED